MPNNVHELIADECRVLALFLTEKNIAYGNSFAEPIHAFSKLPAVEQLKVRIDDKLNRMVKGQEYPGDDTLKDLAGYYILLKVLERLDV